MSILATVMGFLMAPLVRKPEPRIPEDREKRLRVAAEMLARTCTPSREALFTLDAARGVTLVDDDDE
jgi:hypothetical protein